jgi:hypothetical protein
VKAKAKVVKKASKKPAIRKAPARKAIKKAGRGRR